MTLILKAAQFACKAHLGQFRKGPEPVPYFTHLARVAGKVASLTGSTPEMVATAYLHDTLEDTEVTLADLSREFPSPVPEYVECLTNTFKTPGLNRAQRKALDCQRLSQAPRQVKVIKLCDIVDNLYDIAGLKPDFRGRFVAEKEQLLQVLCGTDEVLEAEIRLLIDKAKTTPLG